MCCKKENENLVSVAKASELTGIPEQSIRMGLQHQLFDFGVAVKKTRWCYYIFRNKLNDYLLTKGAN